MKMTVKNITDCLEDHSPLALQESYDNAGLLIGSHDAEITKVLFTLDITNEVLDEAIAKKCGLVVSHHPLIFHGIKKLTGEDLVQKLVVKAIKNNIAIYAMHTNLDNSFHGLNQLICEKLGLTNCSVLSPTPGMLSKLVTFCPVSHAENVRNALFEAGAGHIGKYDCCSFNLQGKGSFRASDAANPFVGAKNVIHFEEEVRIEVIFPSFLSSGLISALKSNHPYEEVAYDIYPLSNAYQDAGSGMIGQFEVEMEPVDFFTKLKSILGIPVLRHGEVLAKKIRRVAICTGSGSFLIPRAINAGADVFLTSDLRYHDYFDTLGRLILADIGHYESERFAKDLMVDILIRKFPNFAFLISEINTNPIIYF